MKLTVIGTGYVGLVTGTCFAEMGNKVYCVDVNEKIINNLKNGIIPIYEPQLTDLVIENQKRSNITFTTDTKTSLENSDIYFIAVGTPMNEDGSCNLTYVRNVASEIGQYMDHDCFVVIKSTVPVGTSDEVKSIINEELSKRGESFNFKMISNPEFLKEGTAVNDCLLPDRIIVGFEDQSCKYVMEDLYEPFTDTTRNMYFMNIRSAELTKYAANAMLASRISFMNEMANICEMTGANIEDIRLGIGTDKRIGSHFLHAGCGYGGSCFPKDVQGIISIAEENGIDPKLLKAIENVNFNQKLSLVRKIINHFGEDLNGLIFGLWGLSFKPNTNDMREASSITLIKELTKRGAIIQAYDPKAIDEAKEKYLKDNENLVYCNNKSDAIKDADAMILVTEWKEFRTPDFREIKKLLKNPVIFDGRNQYNRERLRELGFIHYQIGIKYTD
ncbi:UDP-glucose/GDP-mannose dehydrogenase family protein [uncultured Methanobrevibacter sp.]|uniref:UDP-glucose dehydrogenase family protein n=1 Tax=uncultured Methanobrevibacter sp. TaxID=253161 RepID=UPI0025F76575|nr:UDP-glucose/GDP-mannose dehydrogenase family protein [uncultured Methanobrevibacter sp.]